MDLIRLQVAKIAFSIASMLVLFLMAFLCSTCSDIVNK